MSSKYLHESEFFKDLIEITGQQEKIEDPSLVEKDYWLMHVLWALKQLGLNFHLKGGTSLSKGYSCIHRFSEDIDLKIEPNESLCGFKVYTGKNHDDDKHRKSRLQFFDWVANHLKIAAEQGKLHGIESVIRDTAFDDTQKNRNGGIRLNYQSFYSGTPGLKEGILLEIGFDKTAPNQPRLITSWAYEYAARQKSQSFIDNRAIDVLCYEPKFTFVEKLQAVVRKFRLYKEGQKGSNLSVNFIRHYYDLYQLIEREEVRAFIGTPEYEDFKKERFGGDDTKISNSDAFKLSVPTDREAFEKAFNRSQSLYYRGQHTLKQILERIGRDLDRL